MRIYITGLRAYNRIVISRLDEVVEPACKVDSVSDKIEKEGDLVGCPAHDKSAADHQWRDNGIASSRVYHWTTCATHLNTANDNVWLS